MAEQNLHLEKLINKKRDVNVVPIHSFNISFFYIFICIQLFVNCITSKYTHVGQHLSLSDIPS